MQKWIAFTVKWTIISVLFKIGFGFAWAVLSSSTKADTQKFQNLKIANTQTLTYARKHKAKGLQTLRNHVDMCLQARVHAAHPQLNYPDFYFEGMTDIFIHNLEAHLEGGLSTLTQNEIFRRETRAAMHLKAKEIPKKARKAVKHDLRHMLMISQGLRFCVADKLGPNQHTPTVKSVSITTQKSAAKRLSELR